MENPGWKVYAVWFLVLLSLFCPFWALSRSGVERSKPAWRHLE